MEQVEMCTLVKTSLLFFTKVNFSYKRTKNIYLKKIMDQISEINKLEFCFDMRFSFDIHVDYSTGK